MTRVTLEGGLEYLIVVHAYHKTKQKPLDNIYSKFNKEPTAGYDINPDILN